MEKSVSAYRLTLLGSFGLFRPDGARIEISSKKGMAMLAMLAMAGEGERSRVWLQARLWGSRSATQAQASLRRELSNLRIAMGDAEDILEANHSRIGVDLSRLSVDGRDVDSHLAGATASPIAAFGEFLEGMDLPGEDGFEDWLRLQRDLIGELAQKAKREALELASGDSGKDISALIDASVTPAGEGQHVWSTGAHFDLPSRPSIAVLPFTSVSARDASELADGIVEEISFALARYSTLFVISSATSLIYREATLDMGQICNELGVRYLLRGSVQTAANRVRVSVVLIDGLANQQVWTGRFEDVLGDVFGLQDRIAHEVAILIDSNIERAEMKRAIARPVQSPDAFHLYYRANAAIRKVDPGSMAEAIDLTEQILALEPDNAWAAAMGGFCHATVLNSGWSSNPPLTRELALNLQERSLLKGGDDPVVLGFGAGTLIQVLGDVKIADLLVERSLAIIPGYASTLFWGGWVDIAGGKPDRALERLQLALRLNPRSTVRPFALSAVGLSLLGMGRAQDAVEVLRESYSQFAEYPATIFGLAAALHGSGRADEAVPIKMRLDRLGGPEHVVRFVQHAGLRQTLLAYLQS